MILKTPGREAIVKVGSETVEIGEKVKLYLKAMGRHENLTSIDYCIIRLRLTLKNRYLADDYSPSIKNASKLSHINSRSPFKDSTHTFPVLFSTIRSFELLVLKPIGTKVVSLS
ncbi:hypothetical protein VIBNISO65_1530033 [Vibrio nigripulchritudo SO65]|nr:hypothetical protein VIBNIAM115_450034 [Vibrio nigripulchritudo AM115]CCN44588.1 hypothetical protein VIBNIFTn2_860033 [Vibrio nigripulchritudo FTn2]CCN66551.1 hypothetical protein VIBNIPon4_570051 [Vibrio nigripulchritudo POn4]CCN76183.1 hypothetical protein VIBNISO65_1530033 [Vibrio nigripulchritudo SO65]